ncbi:hypothetical protein Pelo_11129 [Pelomyxa schiedti]|nr:hypothetical protein Pelo_11129 [Pelomyxa schiedti]
MPINRRRVITPPEAVGVKGVDHTSYHAEGEEARGVELGWEVVKGKWPVNPHEAKVKLLQLNSTCESKGGRRDISTRARPVPPHGAQNIYLSTTVGPPQRQLLPHGMSWSPEETNSWGRRGLLETTPLTLPHNQLMTSPPKTISRRISEGTSSWKNNMPGATQGTTVKPERLGPMQEEKKGVSPQGAVHGLYPPTVPRIYV